MSRMPSIPLEESDVVKPSPVALSNALSMTSSRAVRANQRALRTSQTQWCSAPLDLGGLPDEAKIAHITVVA